MTIWKEAGERLSKGDLARMGPSGRVFKARKGMTSGAYGVVVKGGRKGATVSLQVSGQAKVPLVESGGTMTPGPYTTCRQCHALVAVSDVRQSQGYCGNCFPSVRQDQDTLALQTYRMLVTRVCEVLMSPGEAKTTTLGQAIRDMVIYYVQDQLTPTTKAANDVVPEEFD